MSELAFKTLGGHGPDLVMLHGFGSDRLSWAGNAAALTPVARLHSLDLPGHGDSPTDVGDGSAVELSRLVAETLKAHGIARAHLLGHSLGGAIALAIAHRSPESVRSLSLIAPAGLGAEIDHDFLARFPELETPEETAALLSRLVTRPQLINKLTIKRVLDQLEKPGSRAALRRIAAGIQAHESEIEGYAADIGTSSIPRLVIWGSADRISPPGEQALRRFGGTTLLVPEAGHLPHVEGARAVNAALAEFIASLPHD